MEPELEPISYEEMETRFLAGRRPFLLNTFTPNETPLRGLLSLSKSGVLILRDILGVAIAWAITDEGDRDFALTLFAELDALAQEDK